MSQSHRAISHYSLHLLSILIFTFVVQLWPTSVLAQNIQYTANSASLGLRSDFKVNPVTQALELQIPLGPGAYPQRGAGSEPATISYSSKVWRMAYTGTSYFGNGQPWQTLVAAQYAEHSRAGWTFGLAAPQIETVANANYDYSGAPVSQCVAGGDPNHTCCFIDRVRIIMGDGSAHEFRSTDQPIC